MSPSRKYLAVAERAERGMVTVYDLRTLKRRKVLISTEAGSKARWGPASQTRLEPCDERAFLPGCKRLRHGASAERRLGTVYALRGLERRKVLTRTEASSRAPGARSP